MLYLKFNLSIFYLQNIWKNYTYNYKHLKIYKILEIKNFENQFSISIQSSIRSWSHEMIFIVGIHLANPRYSDLSLSFMHTEESL